MHLIVAFAAFVALSTALYTPKGSSCTIECGTAAQNFTGTGDLVCLDTAYDDTTKGVLLKQCVKCLSASTYVNAASYNGNSDQYWYLWHIKYVQQYCLIDTPQTAAAKNCASKCDGLHDPMKVSWIYNKAGVQPQYGICSWNSSAYMTYASDCASCLHEQEGGVIIGNLADTYYNACKTQPQAVHGQLVTSSRDLFDSTVIDSSVTTSTSSKPSSSEPSDSSLPTSSPTPSTLSTSPSDGATDRSTSATTTSTTSAITSAPASGMQSEPSGISSAAAAGLGVGATLLVLAIAAGIFYIVRRKKKASAPQRLATPSEELTNPPAYAHELGHDGQVNEIGTGEKYWHKTTVYESGGVPLQELDGSGRR